MSVIDDALRAILQGSNPDASPEEIASQVEGLKKTGGEAVNQALSFIPGLSTMKDVAVNTPAMIEQSAQNPMIQGMAAGVTGAQIAPGIPNPGNPISGLAQGAIANSMSKMPTEDPLMPKAEEVTLPEPIQSAGPAPKEPTAKPAEKMPEIANAIMPEESSADADARAKAMEEAERRRKMSIVPAAIAGVGDSIAAGASAFGVNAPTDKQDKLLERAKANFNESKTMFDDKIKNDPNSDISKAYRQMVTQIAPDMANKPAFQNMTAQMIGDKLPLIETMMKAQVSRDNKMLELKRLDAVKSAKPVPQTEAQKSVDKAFGKDYAAWVAGGGSADVENQLSTLEGIVHDLKKGKSNLTGAGLSAQPDWTRKRLFPDSVAAQQAVEQSIQRSLRTTLGAQFTEREGTKFLERGYDPALDEKQNAKKLENTISQLRQMVKAKAAAADYYEENGTLVGFKGKLPMPPRDNESTDRPTKDPLGLF